MTKLHNSTKGCKITGLLKYCGSLSKVFIHVRIPASGRPFGPCLSSDARHHLVVADRHESRGCGATTGPFQYTAPGTGLCGPDMCPCVFTAESAIWNLSSTLVMTEVKTSIKWTAAFFPQKQSETCASARARRERRRDRPIKGICRDSGSVISTDPCTVRG